MVKTKYDNIRAFIVKSLASETEYSAEFIRKSIKGERDSEAAESIKKEYKKRYDAAVAILKPNRIH